MDYADDWWTYNLGVGYQFREDFAASLSVTYEPSIGGELTTLGPYDGRTTLNIGAAYDVNESLNLSGGVTYGTIGDTYNVLDTDFNDGTLRNGSATADLVMQDGSVIQSEEGEVEYYDPAAASMNRCFYRLVEIPPP